MRQRLSGDFVFASCQRCPACSAQSALVQWLILHGKSTPHRRPSQSRRDAQNPKKKHDQVSQQKLDKNFYHNNLCCSAALRNNGPRDATQSILLETCQCVYVCELWTFSNEKSGSATYTESKLAQRKRIKKMYVQCWEFKVILFWITGSHACIFANHIMYKNHYQLNLYPLSSDCTQFAITDKHQDAIEPSAAKSHTINHIQFAV